MTYCVYVDNEIEETDLTKDEAIDLMGDIVEEDPEVEVRIAPMLEELEEGEEDEEDDFEDEEEEE